MNELSDIQKQALQQWNDMGNTTPLNPILQFAYEVFVQPMGIKADAFIYDAFSAIEDSNIYPTLPGAKFDAKLVETDWQNYDTIKPLVDFKDDIELVFNENGLIEDVALLKELTADEPNMPLQNFLSNDIARVIELNEEALGAAKLFVDAALELMIRQEPESQDFAKLFIENRRKYAEIVFVILTQNKTTPEV